MDHERVEAFLKRSGYEVWFRAQGWCECLVASGEERWLGLGSDHAAALDDALKKAFPSRAARALLEGAVAVASALSVDANRTDVVSEPTSQENHNISTDTPADAADAAPAAVIEAPAPAPVVPAEPAPEAVRASAPAVAVAVAEGDARPGSDPRNGGTVSGVHPIALSSAPSSAAAPGATPTADADEVGVPMLSQREALAELVALKRQIDGDHDDLALITPRRQRMVLLGWIAHARSYQEALPGDARVDTAVAGIVRVLDNFCKTWWPGSVRALKAQTRPEDLALDLPRTLSRLPRTWLEGCDLIERTLREIEDEDESKGRDEQGWADASKLRPPPRDPDALLGEVCAQVEKVGGPLTSTTPAGAPPEPAKLAEWVRKLRWLRNAVRDVERWGMLVGRFRYWVREQPQRYAEAGRLLEPEYCPDRPWAQLLGKDQETLQRRREVKEVFASVPHVASRPSDDELVAWLVRALPLSDTHHASIVGAMAPFKDHVVALDARRFPEADRRTRRRLAKLQRELANPGAAVLDAPEGDIADESPSQPPAEPAAEPAAEPSNPMPVELLEPVVARTRGKHALFVSNRADPALRDRLRELFEFESIEWSQGEPKRRQALTGPIASGAYDFVLGATGFLSHSVDGQIGRACKKGHVPYIRVHRGRPLACLRAMARELGIDNGGDPQAAEA